MTTTIRALSSPLYLSHSLIHSLSLCFEFVTSLFCSECNSFNTFHQPTMLLNSEAIVSNTARRVKSYNPPCCRTSGHVEWRNHAMRITCRSRNHAMRITVRSRNHAMRITVRSRNHAMRITCRSKESFQQYFMSRNSREYQLEKLFSSFSFPLRIGMSHNQVSPSFHS